MSGVVKGILIGAGGALGVCSQSDSLNDVPRFLLSAALRGYDKVSVKHNSHSSSSDQSSGPNVVNGELLKLTKEISDLRASSQNQSRVVVVGNGAGGIGYLSYVIIGGSVGVVYLYYKGYSFSNIMYASKAALLNVKEELGDKLNQVGVKLEKSKQELLLKIHGVEESVDECRLSLEEKLKLHSEEIRLDLGDIHGKLDSVENGQKRIEVITDKLDSQMLLLDRKFDDSRHQLNRANNGIELLVNSVMDLPYLSNQLADNLRRYIGDRSERELLEVPSFKRVEDKPRGMLGFLRMNSQGAGAPAYEDTAASIQKILESKK